MSMKKISASSTWQVFVRDFVPSALAFLMNDETEIVKEFLLKTLLLQSQEKMVDQFKLGEGVMPASFKVIHHPARNYETLTADFGESAIGRVAPVDSGFWWIILLRAYTKSTGNSSLADLPECQRGMRLILSLCLSEGFDTFPTLLCADGCCMIDRRMVGLLHFPFVQMRLCLQIASMFVKDTYYWIVLIITRFFSFFLCNFKVCMGIRLRSRPSFLWRSDVP